MKLLYNLRWLFILSFFAQMLSCSKEHDMPENDDLSVAFSSTTGEYKVKTGKTVTLSASVTDAIHPVYSWKLDGKIISTDTTCLFNGDKTGEYFLTFQVDAENGSVEKQVKVSVLEKLPPEIDMTAAIIAWAGQDTKLTANVKYADSASYAWRLNGNIVSSDSNYILNQTALGTNTLTLKVTTEDGEDLKVFTVTVLPLPVPQLFFDDGHYRVTSNEDHHRKMTVPLGKSLVLAPVISNIANPITFEWTVDGAVQTATDEYLNFTPAAKGSYTITVTEKSTSARATVQVECVAPEGTYFRPKVAGDKASAANGFDFVPAPGQFINYQIGSTKAKALQDLQTALDNTSAPYIGAYGGYFIVGFDHSVNNVEGKADLRIDGNAFAGWNEPGIVWVMQDENGNGLPDDTWYELKGSETGKSGTKERYAITYYRPTAPNSDVLWTDNFGNTGTVDYNGYHSQQYYFPMFITESSYTLTGTRLASTFVVENGVDGSLGYPWGYVDNVGDGSKVSFWIEDAIKADGTPANLKYIDFVKVHTAMIGQGAAVGEISTEAGVPIDLNF